MRGLAPGAINEPTRAAIYLRASTREQTVENQEPVLRESAARLGLEALKVFSETASGRKRIAPSSPPS